MTQQKTGKKMLGQSMLKLLTEKEKKGVAGGPRGPVPPSGSNNMHYIPAKR